MQENKCQAPECTEDYYAKGHCKRHYTQLQRHGRLTPEKERGVERICVVENCGRTDTIGSHCRRHARQLRVHGRLTPEKEHQMGIEGCKVEGCDGTHRAKGFCVKHYNQDRWRAITDLIKKARDNPEINL